MHAAARTVLVAGLVGVLSLGVAWAGAGLAPAPSAAPAPGEQAAAAARAALERARTQPGGPGGGPGGGVGAPANPGGGAPGGPAPIAPPGLGERLPDGWFLAGAGIRSIAPDEQRWTPDDPAGTCGQIPAHTPLTDVDGCLLTFDKNWATHVDDLGVHVRAMALSNGVDTVALAVMDTVAWFWGYPDDVCGDCGAKAIAEAVSAATDGAITPEGIVISATHTHASADTTAPIPSWYYEQVRDATTDALLDALADLRPALVETGAVAAKAYNTDRRIVTRAIPDYELGYLRAHQPDGETVATLVNFAVHPTVLANNAMLHDGLVGPLAQRLEEHFGGTAMFFPGGLGDQRLDRGFGREGMGHGLAELVIADSARGAWTLGSNDILIDRDEVQVPVDSAFMTAARHIDYFVRDVDPPYGGGPATVTVQKGGANRPSCVSAGANHLVAPVGGFLLGSPGTTLGDQGDAVAIMQAPGEIFASISLVTKDYLSRTRNVLVLGMANDQIGYLIPAIQFDPTAHQGLGLLHNITGTGDYEEALNVGRCSGDQIQTELLRSGERLGVMGFGESP